MDPPERADYIYAQGTDRENSAIEFLTTGAPEVARRWTEPLLGWPGPWAWYAVRIPRERLLPVGLPRDGFPGDIDIMGGPLAFDPRDLADAMEKEKRREPDSPPEAHRYFSALELLGAGQLSWPPPLGVIGAAEVKSSSFFADETQGARPDDVLPKAYAQASGLARMGFDRVAVIWVPATEPVLAKEAVGFAHFMEAGARAGKAAQFVADRATVDEAQPFGQVVMGLGAVPGGLEGMRGGNSTIIRRDPPPLDRPQGSERERIRAAVTEFLLGVFASEQVPKTIPVIIRACPPGGCGRVFVATPPANRTCPGCARTT